MMPNIFIGVVKINFVWYVPSNTQIGMVIL